MNTIFQLLDIKSDFQRLFYVNEYKALAGEKWRIIVVLILILFLTLLALGYAIGSIQNLEKRMSNPFTNWININVTSDEVSYQASDIKTNYNLEENQTKFGLLGVRGWVKDYIEIYRQDFNPVLHSRDTLIRGCWGRNLDDDDPIAFSIISKSNLIWKSPDLNFEQGEGFGDCEMIISKEMMERLGYNFNDLNIGHVFVREGETILPVKVVGVVRALPKFCDFITSSQFYNIKTARKVEGKKCFDLMEISDEEESNLTFIINDKQDLSKIKLLIEEFFTNINEQPEVVLSRVIKSGDFEWSICEFAFRPSDRPQIDSINLFLEFANKKGVGINDVAVLNCDTDYCSYVMPEEFHYFAFNFKRLDSIRKFKDDIKQKFKINVDMNQVEAKENFALVSNLTMVISLILLGFGILSIILFVNSLLRSHLFKIRSNLGTFKAFGLSNQFINSIYLKIIFAFLTLSIFIAFLAAALVDRVEQFYFMEESQFNVFNVWVLLALVLLVIISLIISSRTITKILGDTPGNLIYER